MNKDVYGYYRIHIPGRGMVKLHHLVWEWAGRGRIPRGWCLHHKDEDITNNRLNNLKLMTISNHRKLHIAKDRNFNKKGKFIKKLK